MHEYLAALEAGKAPDRAAFLAAHADAWRAWSSFTASAPT
jgi:hypothetical protein